MTTEQTEQAILDLPKVSVIEWTADDGKIETLCYSNHLKAIVGELHTLRDSLVRAEEFAKKVLDHFSDTDCYERNIFGLRPTTGCETCAIICEAQEYLKAQVEVDKQPKTNEMQSTRKS